MRDRDGNVVGAVFVLRDVPDATQLEQERARATQLESLGVQLRGKHGEAGNVGPGPIEAFHDSGFDETFSPQNAMTMGLPLWLEMLPASVGSAVTGRV